MINILLRNNSHIMTSRTFLMLILGCLIKVSDSYYIEAELYEKLFNHGYNKHVRPTLKSDDVILVTMKLSLTQLVDLDEKNLMMTVNVWLDQHWIDVNLSWDPEDYGNITSILVSSEDIWRPDVVLLENVDGNFTVTHMTKARLHHSGRVSWNPPAIFKSFCSIDVTFFPFDIQNCTMKFASWSYDGKEVDLVTPFRMADMRKMTHNGEWDVVDSHVLMYDLTLGEVLHWKNESYGLHDEIPTHPTVTFCFILRRLPLFYCIFLIAPCLGISFLTALVFYLPSDSQEKVTLSISVLLAHIFYLLVITEIIPASSSDIPLIAEYLLLNMIFLTLSIILTTVVLNIHHRTSSTHRRIPAYLRGFMLETAPRLLWMESPDISLIGPNLRRLTNGLLFKRENLLMGRHLVKDLKKNTNLPEKLCEQLGGAIECAFYIAERIKRKIHQKQESEEYRFIANVLDRIFLLLFLAVSVLGIVILIIPAWMDTSYLHYAHDTEEDFGHDSAFELYL